MPKIISVPQNWKKELEAILKKLSGGVVTGAGFTIGAEVVHQVKSHLSQKNITYQEHEEEHSIPDDHVHWKYK